MTDDEQTLQSPTPAGSSPVPPSHPLVSVPAGAAEGDRIGPYRLVSLLGEGGFGAVYLAEQTEPVRRRVCPGPK